MKSTLANNAKLLPPEEWDFFGLDDQERKIAFYYEYARSVDSFKKEVEKMRAARPRPNVWSYCPREHHLWNLLQRISTWESFPETSWLALKEKTIAQIRQKRAEAIRRDAEYNSKCPPEQKRLRSYWQPDDPITTLDWMYEAGIREVDFRPALGYPGFVNFGDYEAVRAWRERKARTEIIPRELEKFTPQPDRTIMEWAFSWQMSDKELKWFFSAALKDARPKQFKEFAVKPEAQQNATGAFPFRRGAALEWLGVLRRYNAVKGWREYMELYNSAALNKRKNIVINSRDISALAAPREADCRKARLILEWFDKGTPLEKKDFK